MTAKQARQTSVFLAIAIISCLPWLAAEPLSAAAALEPLAAVAATANQVTFEPLIPYDQVRVTVSGPEHFEIIANYGAAETPAVVLPGVDGLYKYELRFAPAVDRGTRELLAKARAAGVDLGSGQATDKSTVQRGWFTMLGGSLVPADLTEQATKSASVTASAISPDQQFVLSNGDGVIRNSLCVGFDCPDAPIFDDSTILLMENNTRIKFGDTSNAPFPNNDWEIEANSNLSGGAGYLGFNDCGTADNDGGCANDLVFAVESGARASALYVESDGDVGIGTSNPVLDLHIVTGNTPALRLDQDGSSGFAPQVWDVAGNEANFFVRDVTGGSRLPLRIRPGAPTSSIDIATTTGNVGIGTAAPTAPLHVRRTDGTAQVLVEETVAAAAKFMFVMDNQAAGAASQTIMQFKRDAGKVWNFKATSVGFAIDDPSQNGTANEMLLENNGRVTFQGSVRANNGAATLPDYVFEPDYALMPLDELDGFVTTNRHLPNVPSRAEVEADGGFIDMTDMQYKLLEKVEELVLYTLEQQRTLDNLATENALLRERLDAVEKAVQD